MTAMDFSPKNPISMIGTFVAVLVFTMFKEAYEDYFRHKSDSQVNNTEGRRLEGSEWVTVKWKDMHVGDILKVQSGEGFPADLIFLSSSNDSGLAFVDTMNLDGETNLKEKMAAE
jgi:phospholipid-transporting ATPase